MDIFLARYIDGTKHELFPNLLLQNFNVEKKNTVWCTDFTYIKRWDGKFQYNFSIEELSDRSIVATKTALLSQNERPKGLILHSN